MQVELDAATNRLRWKCPACGKRAEHYATDVQAALAWIQDTRGYRPCARCVDNDKQTELFGGANDRSANG